MKNKYKLYLGNEEIKLSKNAQKELAKWRQLQIAQDMQKKLDKINDLKDTRGTLDA